GTSTASSASPTRRQYLVIATEPTGVQCESRSTAGPPGNSTAKRPSGGANTLHSAARAGAIANSEIRTSSAAHQVREDRIDRLIGNRGHLRVGPILDRVLHVHRRRIGAERARLCHRTIDELHRR